MPDSLCIVVISANESMMQYTHIAATTGPSSSTTTTLSSHTEDRNNCLFDEYRVEHKKSVIPLAFTVENLIHGFSPLNVNHSNTNGLSPQIIDTIILKLVKRGISPYLSIESRSASGTVVMTHDIPAKLLPPEICDRYSAPRLPLPHVRMLLPDPNRLVAIMDRMKSFGKHVTLAGDMGQTWWSHQTELRSSSSSSMNDKNNVPDKKDIGTTINRGASLVVSIANESASMQTFFRNLSTEEFNPSSSSLSSSTDTPPLATGAGNATAMVSCRDFLRVLKGINHVSPELRESWLFGMIRSRAVFLHLQLEDGLSSITYIHSVIENGNQDGDDGNEETIDTSKITTTEPPIV